VPEGVLQISIKQPLPLVMSSDIPAMKDALQRSEEAAEISEINSLEAANSSTLAQAAAQNAQTAAQTAQDAADAAQSASNTLWVQSLADIGSGPYPDQLPIRVTNDPSDDGTGNVNGLYNWDAVNEVPVRAADSAQPATKGEILRVEENVVTEVVPSTEDLAFVIADEESKVALSIDKNAKTSIVHLESANKQFEAKQDGTINVASTEFRQEEFSEYSFVITDEEDRIAFSISKDGVASGSVSQEDFDDLKNRVEIIEQNEGETSETTSIGIGPVEVADGVVSEIDLDGTSNEIFDPSPYQIDETIPLKTVSKSLVGVWDKPLFGVRSPFAFTPPVVEKN